MKWEMVPVKKEIDIDGFYSFFYSEEGKNSRFAGERHDFWEILYVDSGEMNVIADGVGYVLKQGDLIFHKPMEYHAFAANQNHAFNILVTSFSTHSPSMNFFYNKIFNLNSYQKKLLSAFMSKMKTGFNPPYNIYDYQIAVAHLEQLLLDLKYTSSVSYGRISKKNVEDTFTQIIKTFLENKINQPLTLSDICKRFSVSKSYICELFKKETGQSIIDYFIELKINKAKQLIRQGELNFTQIAEALGYKSIHHFSRSFKSKTGVSPGTYEKSIN